MSMDYDMGQAPKSQRSYVVTLLLAFFLGFLGVHRFYTGYVFIGVIQLLTDGGCGIWTLIDNIALVMNSYRDADGKELEGHNAGCALIVGLFIVLSFIFAGLQGLVKMFAG